MMRILLHLLFYIFVKGIVFCTSKICLTWSINDNQLKLRCQIDNTHMEVSFHDPFNQEQAVCLMSFPTSICQSHYTNGSISRQETQGLTVTVLKISGNIDRRLNGLWTCRHGKNNELATTEVTTKPLTDVAAPVITTNQSLPFVTETVVELVCTMESSGHTIMLEWDCFNISGNDEQVKNCTTYLVKFTLKVSSFLNGKICKCTARINNFGVTAQIKLVVHSKPVLNLLEEVICNESSMILLSCSVSGTSISIFAPWIHSYNGTFIRYIDGALKENRTTILIQPCSFEDLGQYTCRLRTNNFDERLAINKSSILNVLGSPQIVGTQINMNKSSMSASFLSFPPPYASTWYKNNIRVLNSSSFIQMEAYRPILFRMHGTVVNVTGYVSCMIIKDGQIDIFYAKFSICLQNDFGNATHNFVKETGRRAYDVFNINMITWILVVTVIFIITVVLTCFMVNKWYRSNQASLERQIYYAAPQDDNTDIRNAASNYDEINENRTYLEETNNICDDNESEHYIDID